MSNKTLILILAILGLFSLTSSAQLDDGTVAPDFTLTDIDGNDHHLYSHIDEGKTVVLAFFWILDGSSWINHSNGYLADLWNQRGPDGTDDYFVIAIESIASTTIENLNGTGSTQGDWVTGTPYPIVNFVGQGSLIEDFNVVYNPMYYVICPEDTTVRQINVPNVENLTTNSGCAQDTTNTTVVNEIEKNTFTIYPNPAADYIQFTFPVDVNEDTQFMLTNAIGKTVFIGNTNELENGRLPVSHLPSGIYLVTLYTDENVVSQRISVQ